MNYLRNIFTKKPNRDAEVIANKLYHGNVDLTYKNIDSIIEEYNIKVKMDNSLIKDVEDEYYRLVEKDEEINRMNEDKRALAKVIEGNNIPVSGHLAKQLGLPIKRSMSMASGEDEWVDTSSSIEGGMKKRRKTKGKKTKRRNTRKHRKKRY